MENLLTLSFDNLSSRDPARTRKGLRQIEGLLAQVCLSNANHPNNKRLSPHKRTRSDISHPDPSLPPGQPKRLVDLRRDAAFREFFRLQEGFRWNVASRLLETLTTLMGHPTTSSQTNSLILSTTSLLQGILLLHPPSRTLFARQDAMNLLLDLLDPSNPSSIQAQTLLVLVTAMLDCPRNTRAFESLDGLGTVTSLFKSRNTRQDVKMRTLEFLYFYLMPEASPLPSSSPSSAPNTGVYHQLQLQQLQREKLLHEQNHARTHSGESSEMMSGDLLIGGGEEEGLKRVCLTTEEKQKLLGRHLNNVAELVRDLRENAVFAAGSAAAA
ncbi:hypothetical protein KC332_g1618 [Hortaea werneckii]|uniref:Cell division control protein 14 n=2 Tax=Hortaea werneckii TaxID=91943 RepID=A0A3M7IDL8_HORWE|nr:hypothetical protein KC358_g13767 [Hortaea werneckii]OTA23520.1 hypothetical protein BTJ68_13387 [Hortaea werneckii EXF-2000]KAI6845720.1 hypothetical protein KC350_g4267 [Hortaea werneckii]KAI6908788.1 hypothetical protein KC348_g13736 [Hortaea werneckii]KAI6933507.1 hypothetical protein KC341_g8269 [Hortaea werneckii]